MKIYTYILQEKTEILGLRFFTHTNFYARSLEENLYTLQVSFFRPTALLTQKKTLSLYFSTKILLFKLQIIQSNYYRKDFIIIP